MSRRGRAFRRYQMEKRKKRIKSRLHREYKVGMWTYPVHEDERVVGMRVRTPWPCSCSACGNPRRCAWLKGKEKRTAQERRSL